MCRVSLVCSLQSHEVLINTNAGRLSFEGESGLYHQVSYPSTPLPRALNWVVGPTHCLAHGGA